MSLLDKSQAHFWSAPWQEAELEASEDTAQGRVRAFENSQAVAQPIIWPRLEAYLGRHRRKPRKNLAPRGPAWPSFESIIWPKARNWKHILAESAALRGRGLGGFVSIHECLAMSQGITTVHLRYLALIYRATSKPTQTLEQELGGQVNMRCSAFE